MNRKIRDEIGQRRPFASKRQEGVVALLRTADDVRRYFAAVVRPHGLTLQQYNVLRILRGARPDALPTMEIRRRMVEVAPGITRLLDRLVRQGWVERQPAPEDRRQVLCQITTAGLETLAGLDEAIDRADDAVLADLEEAELDRLIAALARVRATVTG